MTYTIQKMLPTDWPPLLQAINDPPKKLFYAGRIPDYERKFLCVVGSRKYTNYGKEAVTSIISDLQGYPVTIVSGLAYGIDALAHRSAMKFGLPTIAVPGSGLSREVLHPSAHAGLAEEIVASGGTLLSEYDSDFKATQWSFPLRNRIMAGMSVATLIIEAEEKSGTMITAKLTTEYNRDLLAIPGSIFSPSSDGPNMFIRLGATLVRNGGDVLEALGIGRMKFKVESEKSENKNGSQISERKEVGEEHLDKYLKEKYQDCGENELVLIKILIKENKPRDELVRRGADSGLSISDIQTSLTLLELKGHIEEKLGEVRLI